MKCKKKTSLRAKIVLTESVIELTCYDVILEMLDENISSSGGLAECSTSSCRCQVEYSISSCRGLSVCIMSSCCGLAGCSISSCRGLSCSVYYRQLMMSGRVYSQQL